MKILKRSGKFETLSFDKILVRLRNIAKQDTKDGYGKLSVDTSLVAKKTIERIHDGISSTELDELSANISANMSTENYEYYILASRVVISNNQKNNVEKYSESVKKIKSYNSNLYRDDIYDFVADNSEIIDSMINNDNDFMMDYFGYKTLEKSYLIKINDKPAETIQFMFMRTSIAIHFPNLEKIKTTYDLMSKKYFIHASPTLFNSASKYQNMSSCFLLNCPDNAIGIFKTISDSAIISKWGGGIGINIQDVRGKGSPIESTNGKSDGIVPMIRVMNATARYMNQGSKRNGSIALYIEPWHLDIFEFLEMKKNTVHEDYKAKDLFYALWIPDLFMNMVKNDEDWHLMCPYKCPLLSEKYGKDFEEYYNKCVSENLFSKKIKARELWRKILEIQIETGSPYLLYKDSSNQKSNQKNLGTIKGSNLCVAPETRILTDTGYHQIHTLENKVINVWNGDKFSETTVLKTGEDKEVMKLTFSDNSVIFCTPYHKFYNKHKQEITAENLKIGNVLEKITKMPIITEGLKWEYNVSPETCGIYYSMGFIKDGKKIFPMNPNNYFIQHNEEVKKDIIQQRILQDCILIELKDEVNSIVPINYSLDVKIKWLIGFSRTCMFNNDNYIKIITMEEKIHDVKLLFTTLGIYPKISIEKSKDGQTDLGILTLDYQMVKKLTNLGLQFPPLTEDNKMLNYISVKSVEKTSRLTDTYCFNEPLNHKGIFNGILTGNCSEIIQYTDKDNIATCNLGSLGLPSFVENEIFNYEKLGYVTEILVENMNNVIDRNFYSILETKNSNLLHRPIGIGVQGLADVFFKMNCCFGDEKSKQINKKIFETIYYYSLKKSCELSKNSEPYSSFKGSPASKGILQFDMWESNDLDKDLNYDWNLLKKNIIKHGLKNSLLTTIMPTASTSQMLGNIECIEPVTSNIYSRSTLSGDFIIINKHLAKDLVKMDLWNKENINQIILDDGSVKNLNISETLKNKYKTVWEISQKNIIDLAADRGIFIDQSQSLNLFVSEPKTNVLTSMHFYAWEKGLKTGCYYLRSKTKKQTAKFTLEAEKPESSKSLSAPIVAIPVCNLEEGCISCSG